MTAAEVMDIISRLLGCDGHAADAVSAYTQLKTEDAPKLLKIPKSKCPDIWIRLPRQYCRSESFAMKTGIPTNGSMVKNHISLRTEFGLFATRRTSFLL